MLSDLLNQGTIQVDNQACMTWKEAILKVSLPLLKNKSIEKEYVDAMIDSVNKNGPYMNIGDQIAMVHARPENGVNKIGLALLKTDPAVDLVNKDHKIKLWFVLSAVDNSSHLRVIQELAKLLGNENVVKEMLLADDVSKLENIIKSN